MAYKIKDIYPSQTTTGDAGWPDGKPRNIQGGVQGTGTPFEEKLFQDYEGSRQALFDEAGIEPSGQADRVGQSDFVDANKYIVAKHIWGDRYKGTFSQGFTFTSDLDVGLDADGKYYKYIGSDAYPVAVSAGTNATDFDLIYQNTEVTSHNSLTNRFEGNAHSAESISFGGIGSAKQIPQSIAGSEISDDKIELSANSGNLIFNNGYVWKIPSVIANGTPIAADSHLTSDIDPDTNLATITGGLFARFTKWSETKIEGGDYSLQTTNYKGKGFTFSGCVVRNTGGGWGFIEDANHAPVGYSSVSDDAGFVRIDLDEKKGKNISCITVADETYARMGITFGASSSLNQTSIGCGSLLNLTFSLSETPTINEGNGYVVPDCTISWDDTEKEFTLTYPTLWLNDKIQVGYDYRTAASNENLLKRGKVKFLVNRVDGNSSTIKMISELNARITWNGSSFDIDGGDASLGGVSGRWSAVWNNTNNCLEITHPEPISTIEGKVFLYGSSNTYIAYFSPLSTTVSRVYFKDAANAMSNVTAPDANMDLWFDKGDFKLDTPYGGHLNVKGGYVTTSPNRVSNANGNIWVYSTYYK